MQTHEERSENKGLNLKTFRLTFDDKVTRLQKEN